MKAVKNGVRVQVEGEVEKAMCVEKINLAELYIFVILPAFYWLEWKEDCMNSDIIRECGLSELGMKEEERVWWHNVTVNASVGDLGIEVDWFIIETKSGFHDIIISHENLRSDDKIENVVKNGFEVS